MKIFKINIIIYILFLLTSCTCKKQVTRWDINKEVRFKAVLSDTNRVLKVGDTLFLSIEVPDTVVTKQNDTVAINTIQEANIFFQIRKLDTINIGFDKIFAGIFARIGSIENSSQFIFDTKRKPIAVKVGYLLNEKGIYSINQFSTQGRFFVNDNIKASTEAYIDVKNSNSDLMLPYLDNKVTDEINRNRGIVAYYFKVQ